MKDVLSAMGYSPAYTTSSGEIWYLSPLRKNETKPSFKICPKGTLPGYVMDVWYDHGEGKGDQILGFIKKYFGITDDSAAIQKLGEVIANSNSGLTYEPVPQPSLPLVEPSIHIQDERIIPLDSTPNKALRNYLFKRGIPLRTAKLYLQEIYYTYQGSNYYALAFPSDSGGYELRNPHFKGAYKTKDISTINPKPGQEEKQVAVFEGFFDFLSYLVHNSLSKPPMPVIVMNSVAMGDKAIEAVRQMGAQTVHLYLDLDPKGREQAERFKRELQDVNVLDQSHIYTGYNDYSEFLEANTQKAKSVSR